MGVYRAAVVTESGQNIIAQALANEQPLIFTSAKTSRYAYPLGINIPALTGLQDVVQSVMPFDSKVINGNVAQVSVRFDNDEIDQVYRIETIGLYAKIEGGTETLFSVTQAITPDEMPIHSDVSPSAYIYNIQHTVQNASQITLTVNPTGTATVQDIMDIEQPEFDDSGTVSGIDSFPAFLNKTKSKMNIFQWYRDFKAGMQFVLHAGQIVNNCVSSDADKPLAAAQGKALQDQLTKLYSDLRNVDAVVKGSLLDYAKNVNTFENVSTGDPTTDIPDSARYCIAHIMYRANSWFISIEGRDNRLYTNYNNGNDWTGWQATALKSDLTDNLNHKKQILPWGNYGDGNHSISNFTFGSNLYIAVGASAKVQKRCSIISPNDIIEIPHQEGFITIVFNDANHIAVSGTTGNYKLREIRASDLLGI